jgi:hypothetical protein
MQWFKRFFEMNVQNLGDYDPNAQRLKGKGNIIIIIYTYIYIYIFALIFY